MELTDGPPFAAAQELLVVLQAPDRALGACAERRATHAERTRTVAALSKHKNKF